MQPMKACDVYYPVLHRKSLPLDEINTTGRTPSWYMCTCACVCIHTCVQSQLAEQTHYFQNAQTPEALRRLNCLPVLLVCHHLPGTQASAHDTAGLEGISAE